MPEILDRLTLYSIGRSYITTRARRIEPTTVDTRGSDANIFVGSTSFMAAAVARRLAAGLAELMLRTARGEALDRWAWDRYQQKRKGAAPARTYVVFTRLSVASGLGTIPAGTRLLTLTGIEYVTLTDATFGSTSLTATAIVRATSAGKVFQVGRNFIRKIARPDQLFDPSITVNNPDVAAGGEDAEDDPAFKERLRDYWRTAQRGTLSAITLGARSVPGVASATAREVLVGDAQPARVVELLIADSSGVASAALAADAMLELDDWRCAGIAVVPSLSTPQIVSVVLKLAFLAGINTAMLTLAIRTAVSEYINTLGANAMLSRAELFAVLTRYRSVGLLVTEQSIVEPAGDIVPAPGFSIRTTISNVTTI